MKAEVVDEFIKNNQEVSAHKDYLDSIIKDSVDISICSIDAELHESRFGGAPLAPNDFTWPTHPEGEYRFLGQINFSEIKNGPDILPDTGILSLFYAYDEEGEIFWGDDDYVVGYYWPNIDELVVYSEAASIETSTKILLKTGVDLPRHSDLRSDWPFDSDVLFELEELEGYREDYLLGYPSYRSLAYDPTPAENWISLITLDSYDELDWYWHDGDKLMVFIEKDKLKNLDFRYLKTDAG